MANKQKLINCLMDAVKQCQIKYGDRQSLASGQDSAVCCLCQQLENIMQHGLKLRLQQQQKQQSSGTIKQMCEAMSSSFNIPVFEKQNSVTVFWHFVRELLSWHERQRFLLLTYVKTDLGRGRSWLRSALNESALEKYVQMMTKNSDLIAKFYDSGALLADPELSAMLPNIVAGLNSVIFAIAIDNPDLDHAPRTLVSASASVSTAPTNPIAVSVSDVSRRHISKGKPTRPLAVMACRRPVAINCSSGVEVNRSRSTEKRRQIRRTRIAESPADSLTPINASSTDSDHSGQSTGHGTSITDNGTGAIGSNTVIGTDGTVTVTGTETGIHTSISTALRTDIGTGGTVSGTDGSTSDTCGTIHAGGAGEGVTVGSRCFREEEMRQCGTVASDVISSSSDVILAAVGADNVATVSPSNDTVCTIQPRLFAAGKSDRSSLDLSSVASSSPLGGVQCNYDLGESSIIASSSSLSCSLSSLSLTADPVLGRTNTTTSATLSHSPHSVSAGSASTSTSFSSLTEAELRRALEAAHSDKRSLTNQLHSLSQQLKRARQLNSERSTSQEATESAFEAKLIRAENERLALLSENATLKRQLKRYVTAVRVLNCADARPGPTQSPGAGSVTEASDKSCTAPESSESVQEPSTSVYQEKLIQVAEMHAELMNFNEQLQRQLLRRKARMKLMRVQLRALSGGRDVDTSDGDDVVADGDVEGTGTGAGAGAGVDTAGGTVNVWVPSVFLSDNTSGRAHHVYQVYLRLGCDEWNVYHRYSSFRRLYRRLRQMSRPLKSFRFPPKQTINRTDLDVAEVRRQQLQRFLRLVLQHVMSSHLQLATSPSRCLLIQAEPFFGSNSSCPVNFKQSANP